MFQKVRNHYYRKRLTRFLDNLKRPVFNDRCLLDGTSYLDAKKHRIDALKWLVSYYSNEAASTPTELLESLLRDTRNSNFWRGHPIWKVEWVDILYHWINYKRIVGF